MRTSNPTLNDAAFERALGHERTADPMTVNGAVGKTALLLVMLLVPALWVWTRAFAGWDVAAVAPYALGGTIGGLVVALATVFKPTWSPVTAPIYAILEGLALGAISAFFEVQYPGIAVQAVMLTFGTLAAMLVAYQTGLIRATPAFRRGVIAATGGIMLVYLVSFVLSFFGIAVPFLHDGGPLGIAIGLFITAVAALNLVLDFDFIERGAEAHAPKYMEWYAAFGLLVTLVWLYLEMVRLLARLRR